MENLTKLTGSFQRRLSCFLFRESGCQRSNPLSAPLQSIMLSQNYDTECYPCSVVSWHWWLNSSRIPEGGGESFSYSVLLLLLLPPFSTRASVPPHPPPTPPVQHHCTNTPTPADLCVLWRYSSALRWSEGLLQRPGRYYFDQIQLINKSISVAFLMAHATISLFSLRIKFCQQCVVNDVGCSQWLVKFLPFCVACQSPTIDERVLCLTVRQAIQVL